MPVMSRVKGDHVTWSCPGKPHSLMGEVDRDRITCNLSRNGAGSPSGAKRRERWENTVGKQSGPAVSGPLVQTPVAIAVYHRLPAVCPW